MLEKGKIRKATSQVYHCAQMINEDEKKMRTMCPHMDPIIYRIQQVTFHNIRQVQRLNISV